VGFFGAAERLLFNIGRIPVKQSREPSLHPANGKSCREAEKETGKVILSIARHDLKLLKYIDIF
jgi:hypothetical protein